MKSNYKRLGPYIKQIDVRNVEDVKDNLLGVSVSKSFIKSIANTIGTNFTTYRVVKKNQFTYIPDTSRRGEKIAIALLEDLETGLVSQAYTVFEVSEPEKLLPQYLMMWFRRPEFDRYARFISHGSVREIFSWEDMCNVELPIPSIKEQKRILNEYNILNERIKVNNMLIQKLKETAQIIFKQWFVDFDFPDHNGLPYKKNGGEMTISKDLGIEFPVQWHLTHLKDVTKLITKGTTPKHMFSEASQDRIVFIKGEAFTENHGFEDKSLSYIDKKTVNSLKRSIIEEEDILLTIAGTLGKFAKISKRLLPANTNQAVAIIRLDKEVISPNFLFWLFLGKWHQLFFAQNTQQAVQANLSLATVGNLPILIPDKKSLDKLNGLINPIVELIQNKLTEIQVLEKMCETVLEKVSKGE